MEPMRLTAIGTSEKRSYYILAKEPSVEKPINRVMREIGLGDLYFGEEGNSPTDYENHIEHISSKDYDIDIVYTRDRIVLIVRASKNKILEFKKLLLKYSEFER